MTLLLTASLVSGCGKKTVEEETYRTLKVDSTSGNIIIERGENMDAVSGMALIPDDVVVVEEGSETVLLADSDKHIYANEKSSFSIYTSGDETSGSIKINLLYGDVRFAIDNKLNENSTFEVTTPNASLSVRGTIFQVAYDKDTDTTLVAVEDGTVYADYNGLFDNEEIKAGQLRVIDKTMIVDTLTGWNSALPLYELGVDIADSFDNYLYYAEGGTVTDTCLEFRNIFIDFANAPSVFPGATVEKRSSSNLVVYFYAGTENEVAVQYSTGYGDYYADSVRDVMFSDGYVTTTLSDGNEAIYTLEEEADGTRAIIMQHLGNGVYVSIRGFNDIGMDNEEFVDMILVRSYYPIYSMQ